MDLSGYFSYHATHYLQRTKTMKALLIVAHGSRREESNDEIRALTKTLATQVTEHFDLVDSAFLELASPLIPDGIQSLVDRGAQHVQILPYFLARGTHVADDIPAEVAKAQAVNPSITMALSQYLGASAAMPNMLRDIAVSSLNQ